MRLNRKFTTRGVSPSLEVSVCVLPVPCGEEKTVLNGYINLTTNTYRLSVGHHRPIEPVHSVQHSGLSHSVKKLLVCGIHRKDVVEAECLLALCVRECHRLPIVANLDRMVLVW